MKRDEAWLQAILDKIWDNYFPEVAQENDVRIVFGRRSKRRLGSISLDPHDHTITIITMNGIFRRSDIPEFVVEATIFHELTHYAHGFNSPLAQAQAHPHAGGVMRREFAERGLLELYQQQKRWLKANWPAVLAEEFVSARRVRPAAAPVRRTLPKPFWFIGE
ncbi:MAG TPA: hypothetical protein VHQ86_00120 [Candidatus Saccharimonadia bacterium]|jgi:hypothetical protein|nr:hypothetical protein [Candidatus Saccharimonadia bacterium]